MYVVFMSFFLTCFLCVGYGRYHDQATIWCSKVLQSNPDHEEQILLLNLLYWSWQYSATMLRMQAAVVKYLKHSGQLIHEAMGARLNPAQLSSILRHSTAEWEHNCVTCEQAHKVFKKELEQYRFVAATYAQCIEYLMKIGSVRSELRALVKILRQSSREARMNVWQEQIGSLSGIMDNLTKIMKSLGGPVRLCSDLDRGFLDYVLEYVAPAAFNSFATFDKKYTVFNAQVWNTLVSSYAMGNILWETTEQVRVDFYTAHYDLLLQLLSGPEEQPWLQVAAFDPEGFVEAGKRVLY